MSWEERDWPLATRDWGEEGEEDGEGVSVWVVVWWVSSSSVVDMRMVVGPFRWR